MNWEKNDRFIFKGKKFTVVDVDKDGTSYQTDFRRTYVKYYEQSRNSYVPKWVDVAEITKVSRFS